MRATKRDKLLLPQPRPLTPEQLNAVDLLAAGETDAAVATAVGVHRVTVTRWRASPTFAAALNRRRTDLFAAAADSLRALVPTALAAVTEALTDDDRGRRAAAAFELLKLAKVSAGGLIGPTDPRLIVEEEVNRRKATTNGLDDNLAAIMKGEPTRVEQFAAAWADLEAAAAEPPDGRA